ncbi:MAG: flagellin [Verrucomicrobia bacterium]|nr:flagellin [Verrucomicrobiota bacterium]
MAVSPVNEIATNSFGFVLARILNNNATLLQESLLRLTTGLKSITDDPSGIASTIRTSNEIGRISGVETALANAASFNDSRVSFLDDVSTSLSRMSELATSSQSSTTTSAQRSANQVEFEQLQDFISSVGTRSFNGLGLFGTTNHQIIQDADGGTFTLQAVNYTSINTASLIFTSGVDVSTTSSAATAVAAVSTAVASLTVLQGVANAGAGRIDNITSTLTIQKTNLQAIVDRVNNVDTTAENENFSNLSLLTQTGSTLIAQYNLLRSNLLTLFQ